MARPRCLSAAEDNLQQARTHFDYAQPADNGTTRCLSAVEGNLQQARTHIETAAQLIQATGYRRDPELAELQARV
ncbi:MAG: hypothetical protein R3E95_02765 [Thiolinea sp.]